MDGWTDGQMDRPMDKWTDGWTMSTDGWTDRKISKFYITFAQASTLYLMG